MIKQEILGEMGIGNTSTLDGLYKLLAVIRLLANWIHGPYTDWLTAKLMLD
jgi:hypothetical protein